MKTTIITHADHNGRRQVWFHISCNNRIAERWFRPYWKHVGWLMPEVTK